MSNPVINILNNPYDHSLGILIGLSLNLRKMILKREIDEEDGS